MGGARLGVQGQLDVGLLGEGPGSRALFYVAVHAALRRHDSDPAEDPMIRAALTLAAVALVGIVLIAALEEVDRLLRRDWPFAFAVLAIWILVRNPFRGRI